MLFAPMDIERTRTAFAYVERERERERDEMNNILDTIKSSRQKLIPQIIRIKKLCESYLQVISECNVFGKRNSFVLLLDYV